MSSLAKVMESKVQPFSAEMLDNYITTGEVGVY